MEGQAQVKPTAVVLIGWFGILISIISLLLYFDDILFAEDLDTRWEPFSPTITYFLNIYFNLSSVFFLISSIFFLKLRMWARNAMEILSWIGIIDGVILLIIFLKARLVYDMMMDSDTPYTVAMEVLLTALFLFVFVFALAVSIVIIVYLRTSKVRNAMIQ